MTATPSTLFVGERVVSQCASGLLEAEYALFDRGEVMLSSVTGHGTREGGYLTTAAFARARLHAALVTPDLAHEAFAALRSRGLAGLARSASIAGMIERIGPIEAFDGGELSAETGRYRGVWLDLDAIAVGCPMRDAGALLQALHLVLLLDEVSADSPVRLLVPGGGTLSGERTWRRVPLEGAQRLPWVLREASVSRPSRIEGDDDEAVREGILRSLRARAVASALAQPRLDELAEWVAVGVAPPPAKVVTASSPPPRPSSRPPRAAGGVVAPSERAALRDHAAELRSGGKLRDVATSLSQLAEAPGSQPELVMLAARAWLAAGELGHARYFARKVLDDPSLPADARHAALEVLEAVPKTHASTAPPAVEPIQPAPVIVVGQGTAEATEDRGPALAGASLPPGPVRDEVEPAVASAPSFAAVPVDSADVIPIASDPAPVASAPETDREVSPPLRLFEASSEDPPRAAPGPPRVVQPPRLSFPDQPQPVRLAPVGRARIEIVETLSLDPPLSEDLLEAGAVPRDPLQARVAMTRLARELGRQYRLAYGTTLMTDVLGIDRMQNHLRRRVGAAPGGPRSEQLEIELMRHGALMSEILSRRLGANWADVSGEEPGRWAMIVPPSFRVWPIGRVYRFFWQGFREADLVAFYLELEAAAQG